MAHTKIVPEKCNYFDKSAPERERSYNKYINILKRECRLLVRYQASTSTVLRTIADDKSLDLFSTVALETIDSKNLKSKTKLTRKQYYSRLARMTRAGLVRRKNGKYILTTFGKIVYDSQLTIENALNNYWKLKAIDSLETSNELPKEEQQKLIETLLDNQELKEILVKGSAEPRFRTANTIKG